MTRRCALVVAFLCRCAAAQMIEAVLPGTRPLDLPADWRDRQQRQILACYQERLDKAAAERSRRWMQTPLAQHRRNLRAMLGLLDRPRFEFRTRTLSGGADGRLEELIATADDGFSARALLSVPAGQARLPAVIAIPPEGGTSPAWLGDLLSRRSVVAVVPTIERSTDYELGRRLRGKDRRRLLHRLAFIAGRTLTGLEVEQALAVRDYLSSRADVDASRISLFGAGQGGMTAVFAAAVEERFASATVVEDPSPRLPVWQQPVDRMLYGQEREFGDEELKALIAPRPLILARDAPGAGATQARRWLETMRSAHFEAWLAYLRRVDARAEQTRTAYWSLESTPPAERAAKAGRLRRELERLLGVPAGLAAPLDPRTRLLKITDKYVAYEVMLGVRQGVEAFGHLLVPRSPCAHLPAVICQHGLGGQPKDITGLGDQPDSVYHQFGARLAEAGYVVFAPYVTVPIPQAELINPIVRKAAALGGMRTGIEVAKLRRIVDFLVAQPFVDPQRIGYYGLSYGGYSAIWMCPVEPRIRAVVVSGHFNDWAAKITSEELTTSYLFHPDEDFYNWNVLNRFTHVELIAAMYPRPVMVEFADRDATTTPEWHERAWRKVQRLARAWNMEDRVARDVFHGVHEIGGAGTFAFLDRWLKPERASGREYKYLLWPGRRDLPGLADNAEDTLPYIRHNLDGNGQTRLRCAFRVSTLRPVFSGLALKLSRAGDPGPLLARFGTKPGAADIGEARIAPAAVHPLYDLWYEARVPARRLDPSRLYFAELRAQRGTAPLDCYEVYGPKRLGGISLDHEFPFACRVLDGSHRSGEDTHEFVRALLDLLEGTLPPPPGRRERFRIRITTSILPGGQRYTETSRPHVPQWFYEKHPEVRGAGWGTPMCTSDERVRRYHAEIVENLFRRAPGLRGLIVIYDSEGFFYCGNSEASRAKCPRCRNRSSEELALEVLTNLKDAIERAGGSGKRLIAWNYGTDYAWIRKLIPKLPKDILFQVDFSKGGLVERDGIRHFTGDYNLTLAGPPEHFVEQYRDARAAGLEFLAKTEHAVSQEFIFVPYNPAMEQWYRRIARIRDFDVAGWFGNWCHYGYLASLPAQLINRMSFDPVPAPGTVLYELASSAYGERAASRMVAAWKEYSDGIRLFPYSDRVARTPGPLQKGPSHPLWLDPGVKSFGQWRSWQNDLEWTRPWGPDVAAKYLGQVKEHFSRGIAATEAARGETSGRRRAALEADSRLGYASEGGGVQRGGLFTPELVRWKIGQLDDLLVRELPRVTGRPPARVPFEFSITAGLQKGVDQ